MEKNAGASVTGDGTRRPACPSGRLKIVLTMHWWMDVRKFKRFPLKTLRSKAMAWNTSIEANMLMSTAYLDRVLPSYCRVFRRTSLLMACTRLPRGLAVPRSRLKAGKLDISLAPFMKHFQYTSPLHVVLAWSHNVSSAHVLTNINILRVLCEESCALHP